MLPLTGGGGGGGGDRSGEHTSKGNASCNAPIFTLRAHLPLLTCSALLQAVDDCSHCGSHGSRGRGRERPRPGGHGSILNARRHRRGDCGKGSPGQARGGHGVLLQHRECCGGGGGAHDYVGGEGRGRVNETSQTHVRQRGGAPGRKIQTRRNRRGASSLPLPRPTGPVSPPRPPSPPSAPLLWEPGGWASGIRGCAGVEEGTPGHGREMGVFDLCPRKRLLWTQLVNPSPSACYGRTCNRPCCLWRPSPARRCWPERNPRSVHRVFRFRLGT